MIPQKAPELLLSLVNPEYGYAVNCAYPNSFRLLNRGQYEIVQSINNRDDIQTLAIQLRMPSERLHQFLLLLSKTEIVRFDNSFSLPKKSAKPKSLNFWIHTTNACNLGCSYCYISTLNTGKGMNDTVRQQLMYKLLEVVKVRGIKQIKLRLAGGEPMGQFNAWKAFIPAAATILAEAGCKLDVAFITNLTLLNEDILEFSKKHRVSYGVSLDGVAEIHDATRRFRSGSGSFQLVDTNLRRLVAEKIPVSVNTVVSNVNIIGLPDLTRYLISLDIPFRYSIVKGAAIDAALLDNYLAASHAIMGEAIETGWQFSQRYQFCDLKPNELGFQTCASGFSGGAIYVDGSFKYCHVHFGKESDSSRSIFNEELDLVAMIESGQHDEEIRSADCRKCRYRSVCTSGCPVYRVEGKDPQCSLYHRFIPQYYELQAKERLRLLRQYEMI
ncbi:radical SAM protein [Adhaeribacter arboris]|uniref:Radical SAM protein n=1 Tax=Adhaeribacter arboris TaxID=2072846 RepID=A0A2T2YPF5_9BACT|nr:radical SAM protein [Adhaeribacter arboris]